MDAENTTIISILLKRKFMVAKSRSDREEFKITYLGWCKIMS